MDGRGFAIKTLKFMRDKLMVFKEETGSMYSLEETPAEVYSRTFECYRPVQNWNEGRQE